MRLTDLEIKKTKPREKRFELSDGDGLALRVMPTGAKSWIYRYRFAGKVRRMTLGQYPGVSLANARERHQAAARELQRGFDPAVKRDSAPTFENALKEFWEIELVKTVSGKERHRMIAKDVIPQWGRRKLADITRRDAVVLLDRVRDRAPVLANRLQSTLVRMFNFSAERGLVDVNPLAGLRTKPEKSRDRILTAGEVKSVWKALDISNKDIQMHISIRLAIKMILLTGQRPTEVTGTAWNEIDYDNLVWNIPPERVKSRTPQSVPLNPMALALLDDAKKYSGDSAFVFTSNRNIGHPISRISVSFCVRKYWLEMGAETAFTPHDLRRTVRSMLAELKVDDIVAERVLGHKLQGVLAVYNRYDYAKEKRQALARWEQRLSEILGYTEGQGGKVISIMDRR